MQGAPLLLRLYRGLSTALAPLAYRRVAEKLRAQGVSTTRLPERRGVAGAPRPDGALMWFHAASVGESVSVLRLITELGEQQPGLSFLLTSGTATSAEIVAKRLPARTIHQFAPLDSARYVRRFLDHWRPDAGVFVESELWPNMLRQSQARGVPLALINARISDSSARNWARFPLTATTLLSAFRMIHCQDARTAGHFRDLGARQAEAGVNLKSLSGPLAYDSQELERVSHEIEGRPVWLASSTHPGEDEIMLAAHVRVLQAHSDALLILVPRHPERAEGIMGLIGEAGLSGAQRSQGARPVRSTPVYLADTLGETGLWYQIAPITCLCGSFAPFGGHNPFEVAHAGSALLHGPLYANFSEAYPALHEARAAREVEGGNALAQEVLTLLEQPAEQEMLAQNARAFAHRQDDALAEIAQDLSNALGLR